MVSTHQAHQPYRHLRQPPGRGGLRRWPSPAGGAVGGHRGAAYLYPLVSGPKIQNKTMLDEPRRGRGKTSNRTRSRQAGWRCGRGGGGRAMQAQGRAGQVTLTELLQLRGHGLGAQREGRGRSPLGGRGRCRGRQERPGVRLAPLRGARPNPPSHARGLSLRLSACKADGRGRPPGWAGWPVAAGPRQSLGWGHLQASRGL